jgi:hypothetical protein
MYLRRKKTIKIVDKHTQFFVEFGIMFPRHYMIAFISEALHNIQCHATTFNVYKWPREK